MCEDWARDPAKATFIICDRERLLSGPAGPVENSHGGVPGSADQGSQIYAMVGDVNLFLQDESDGSEGDGSGNQESENQESEHQESEHQESENQGSGGKGLESDTGGKTAEIDVMIGFRESRRRGYARQAVGLMEAWARVHLGVSRLVAKIKTHNEASAALFTSMGYVETKRVEIFQEIHYEKQLVEVANNHQQ